MEIRNDFGTAEPGLRRAAGAGLRAAVQRRAPRLLVPAAVLLPMLMMAAGALFSWGQAWREAEAEVTRTAEAGGEYARRILDSLLLRADRVNELLAGLSDEEIRAREGELHLVLRALAERTQDRGTLHAFVHDREGRSLVSGEIFPVPPPSVSFADREYNRALRGPGAADFHIGEVFVGQVLQRPFFVLVRKRDRTGNDMPSGAYDGIVAVSADANAVGAGLRRLVPGGDASSDVLALIRGDGHVLSRSTGLAGPLPPLPATNAVARGIATGSGPEREVFVRVSGIDGVERLAALRRVEGWPAFISVARPRSAIVAQWRAAVAGQLALGIPATVGLLALALVVRQRTRDLANANALLARRVEERSRELVESVAARSLAERRHAEVLASIGEVIYALDADTRFAFASDRALQLWGRDRSELIGVPLLEAFPNAAGSVPWQAQVDAIVRREETHLCVVSPVIGRWIEIDIYPREGGGITVAFRDAHDLRDAHLRRTAVERRLRLATAAGRLGLFEIDFSRRTITRSGEVVPGRPDVPLADLPIETWLARVHPDDLPDVRAALARVEAGHARDYRIEYRFRPDPRAPWIRMSSQAVVAELEASTGRPMFMVGVTRDVTQERAAEERQLLMAREVDHRAKNALTMVQSVLRLTRADDPRAFAQAVEGRVGALARAQGLLAEVRWAGVELRALLVAELAAFLPAAGAVNDAPGLHLDGPPVMLAPDAAQPVSMIAHELATNATKYGALSVRGGRVALSWAVDGAGGTLELLWEETGGPVTREPERRGFGTRVIDRLVGGQLAGRISRSWASGGLTCRMVLPLTRVVADQAAADAEPFVAEEVEAEPLRS